MDELLTFFVTAFVSLFVTLDAVGNVPIFLSITPHSSEAERAAMVSRAALAVLAVLVAFLLIRTRAGLIYEVAKMNALLGLPIGRVQRIGWLSIFTILQTIISLAGGCSSALFCAFMINLAEPNTNAAWPAVLIGIAVTASLLFLYVATVRFITSEKRLQGIGK